MDTSDRAHFFALAGKAIRQILCSYARRRRAKKREGSARRIALGDVEATALPDAGDALSEEQAELFILLDNALGRLERVDPRRARVVECRFFGGMTIAETATALEISPRTVKRDWSVAQAWLQREMKERI